MLCHCTCTVIEVCLRQVCMPDMSESVPPHHPIVFIYSPQGKVFSLLPVVQVGDLMQRQAMV